MSNKITKCQYDEAKKLVEKYEKRNASKMAAQIRKESEKIYNKLVKMFPNHVSDEEYGHSLAGADNENVWWEESPAVYGFIPDEDMPNFSLEVYKPTNTVKTYEARFECHYGNNAAYLIGIGESDTVEEAVNSALDTLEVSLGEEMDILESLRSDASHLRT